MISQQELGKRIANMHRQGILKSADVPTVWQVEQAGWIMQPGITRIRPLYEPDMDTWWGRMPQRLILQGLTGSGSKDGTGFARNTDSQIWHILTINHRDVDGFGYDLEMLAGHDNGLEQMLQDVRAMRSRSHPLAWLARQIVGTDEYWANVEAATVQFMKGNFEFNGTHVQPTVDLALSFPATPAETLKHSGAIARHLETIGGMIENGVDLVTYVFKLKPIEAFPLPEPSQTPAPLGA